MVIEDGFVPMFLLDYSEFTLPVGSPRRVKDDNACFNSCCVFSSISFRLKTLGERAAIDPVDYKTKDILKARKGLYKIKLNKTYLHLFIKTDDRYEVRAHTTLSSTNISNFYIVNANSESLSV